MGLVSLPSFFPSFPPSSLLPSFRPSILLPSSYLPSFLPSFLSSLPSFLPYIPPSLFPSVLPYSPIPSLPPSPSPPSFLCLLACFLPSFQLPCFCCCPHFDHCSYVCLQGTPNDCSRCQCPGGSSGNKFSKTCIIDTTTTPSSVLCNACEVSTSPNSSSVQSIRDS